MKFAEFSSAVRGGDVHCVYLFEGDDAFFRTRARMAVESRVLSQPELNASAFEGAQVKGAGVQGLYAALTALPFLSERRVVFVREWYPTAAELKASPLAGYFDAPADTTVLMISNEKKCEALKKLACVTLVDCGRAEIGAIAKWVRQECAAAKIECTDGAVRLLAEFCLSDMTRVSTETQKLLHYASDKGQITEADVRCTVAPDSEYKVYELTEHIASRRTDDAYRVLLELTGKNESKQKMFVSLYSHFRRLLHVALSQESDSALASALGVKEYAVKVARRQAQKFTKKALKAAVDKLTELDVAFKTGKTSLDSALLLAVFGLTVN